ncbi:hypothetical protein CTI14_56965 [Methylobacterium radiotolerans]|nr:hypothetical protein CTI14_56965 [Methylobacterium radiotolerans]
MHHHRAEHWIVVSGTARIYNGRQAPGRGLKAQHRSGAQPTTASGSGRGGRTTPLARGRATRSSASP